MDGIIVASDITLEWMLPWWWERYQAHNALPVAFIDLGLSFEMKEWCRERGELISLRVVDFVEDSEVDSQTAKTWEEEFGKLFWESRNAWFKKPLACLKSPFERTLWLDVDCEVRGSVTPLFNYTESFGFGMAKEQVEFPKKYQYYNSGVIVFRQNHPLLKEWAEGCLKENKYFRGDEDVLCSIIAEKKHQISVFPPLFNWSRCMPERPDIVVLHWHGQHGKFVIRSQLQEQNT